MEEAGRKTVFQEVQKFTQPWLVVLVLALAGWAWFLVVSQLFFDWPAEPGVAEKIIMAVVWLLVGVGLPALLLGSRLITEVRPDGIYIRYIPFHRAYRRYAWEEIRESAARRYRPVREYGGWGIRGLGNNRAYNVSGGMGLQLVFKNGRRLLIGSQRADELAAAVEAARKTSISGVSGVNP